MRLNGVVHKLESVTKGLNFFVIIWVKMVGGKNAEGERRGMGEKSLCLQNFIMENKNNFKN